jgi:hypothetical protein
MPRGQRSVDRELEALGAQVKIAELQKQIDDLRRRFPSVRATNGTGRRTGSSASATVTVRKRRKMSAAERKAVSARMKRFWAERRKAKS